MNKNDILTSMKTIASNLADKAAYAGKKVFTWISENPEAASAILVPITVNAIQASRSLVINHRENRRANREDYKWYDRSTGLRWTLKRKMTNNDRLMLLKMKETGMPSYDVLKNLDLI